MDGIIETSPENIKSYIGLFESPNDVPNVSFGIFESPTVNSIIRQTQYILKRHILSIMGSINETSPEVCAISDVPISLSE